MIIRRLLPCSNIPAICEKEKGLLTRLTTTCEWREAGKEERKASLAKMRIKSLQSSKVIALGKLKEMAQKRELLGKQNNLLELPSINEKHQLNQPIFNSDQAKLLENVVDSVSPQSKIFMKLDCEQEHQFPNSLCIANKILLIL